MRSSRRRRCLGLAPALLLGACALQREDIPRLRAGPPAVLTEEAARTYATRVNVTEVSLRSAAGLPETGALLPAEWRIVGTAAFAQASEECDAYLAALDRLEAARGQTSQQLNLAGTATAAILGLTQVASTAIAITGTAFGLVQSSLDTAAGGLAFEVKPTGVSDLVRRLRAAYEADVTRRGDAPWADRPTTLRTIGGFRQICTPAFLRARIADSVNAAQFSADAAAPGSAPPDLRVVPTPAPAPAPAAKPQNAAPQANAPVAAFSPSPDRFARGGDTDAERRTLSPVLNMVQSRLCLPASPDWATTRDAVTLWRAGRPPRAPGSPVGLEDREIADLLGERACDRGQFQTYFEFWIAGTPAGLARLQCRLDVTGQATSPSAAAPGLAALRPAIRRTNAFFTLPANDRLTPELWQRLAPCPPAAPTT